MSAADTHLARATKLLEAALAAPLDAAGLHQACSRALWQLACVDAADVARYLDGDAECCGAEVAVEYRGSTWCAKHYLERVDEEQAQAERDAGTRCDRDAASDREPL